ncbi:MAG TPA: J domain-containing protein [Chloroflexota bacterium]|nr:J domain-containing protein [Chloroflexota bacterium]
MGEARHTDIDLARTKRELIHCLDVWPGAEYVSIGDYRDQAGGEAVVVFRFNGNLVRIVYDEACCHRCNMRAVFLTLDALRLAYKRGLGDVLGRTVAQMLALPGAEYIDPYELLGVRPDAPMEVIEASYRALVKQWHPDRNPQDVDGALRKTTQLNEAIAKVRADRRERDGGA